MVLQCARVPKVPDVHFFVVWVWQKSHIVVRCRLTLGKRACAITEDENELWVNLGHRAPNPDYSFGFVDFSRHLVVVYNGSGTCRQLVPIDHENGLRRQRKNSERIRLESSTMTWADGLGCFWLCSNVLFGSQESRLVEESIHLLMSLTLQTDNWPRNFLNISSSVFKEFLFLIFSPRFRSRLKLHRIAALDVLGCSEHLIHLLTFLVSFKGMSIFLTP